MTARPNFFIIGASKSGTTSLYEYLRDHPQVFMSAMKEPNYFSLGMGDMPHPWGPAITMIRDLDAYHCLFSGVTDEVAIGEASSSYLHVPETAKRISRYVPEAKLIAILRDPIERAYSAFLMWKRIGMEPRAHFYEAIEAEQRGESKERAYLERSRYAEQLQRYLEHFAREQLQIHLYDDLRSDARQLVSGVFHFLGVSDSFRPDTSRRHNVAESFHAPGAQTLLDELPRPIRSTIQRLVPVKVRHRVYRQLRAWNARPPPSMPPAIRQELLPLVRDDILALQDLIGRDLSAWLIGG